MTSFAIILILAGILAGLIQYFVDFKGLPLFQPPAAIAKTQTITSNGYLSKLYKFIKNHWQFFGYIIIGIAGAFLTPLINELTNNRLSGLDVMEEYAKCISSQKDGIPPCTPPGYWYYLILFGYGIVFGYSSVRLVRNISLLVLGNISLKQDELQKKMNATQKQVEELNEKIQSLTKPVTTIGFAAHETSNNDYFNDSQNEIDKRIYYASIDLDKSQSLFTELNQLISNTHKIQLQYQPSLHLYPIVDRYEDSLLRSIYSGKSFNLQTILKLDAQVDRARANALSNLNSFNFTTDLYNKKLQEIEELLPYNCEHSVPQSWFEKLEPMRGDLHHLFTCEMRCNSFRSNNPYFDFPDYGKKVAEIIKDECGKLEQNHFEPEQNKGVVARAVLYFLLRYPGKIISGKGYNLKDIPMLIQWHKDNKVSLYELHRNHEIYKVQGNRNPFIDYPELVDKVDFKQMGFFRRVSFNINDDAAASSELLAVAEFDTCIENPNPKPWKDWRPAESLKILLTQINSLAANRSKDSDGMIGDAEHQSRDSDHNPWVWDAITKKGVVTALDITHDPINKCDCSVLAMSLETNKDVRIKYVIWNKRIMNSSAVGGIGAWIWRTYEGENPHDKHIHISVKCEQSIYDSATSWNISLK